MTPPPFDIDCLDDRGELAVRPAPPEIDAAPTTLVDFKGALETIAAVLVAGEARHRGAWRRQSIDTHADHLTVHLIDGAEARHRGRRLIAREHYAHAATRALMALALALQNATNDEQGGHAR